MTLFLVMIGAAMFGFGALAVFVLTAVVLAFQQVYDNHYS